MTSKNLSIMFTDIRGYTTRTSTESRGNMAEFMERHGQLLTPVFRHFGGNLVRTVGDAFLVTFESPTDSVLCGIAIQEVLRQYNATVREGEQIAVRVAINSGEVDEVGGDLLGEAVNIAARLEAITDAGEVYFTEAVYLSMNKNEAPTSQIGEHTFKGIPHSVRVYKVVQDPKSPYGQQLANSIRLTENGPVISILGTGRKSNSRMIKIAVASFIVILAALTVAYQIWYPALDGQNAARTALAVQDGKPIDELMARYPKNGEPLYAAAVLLEDNAIEKQAREKSGGESYTLGRMRVIANLYMTAQKRGARQDDERVFRFYTESVLSWSGKGYDYGLKEAVFSNLVKYYPREQVLAWARRAITVGNPRAVSGAWELLKDSPADPERDYAQALADVTHGRYLERALPVLEMQTDPLRRKRIAEHLQRVISDFPAYFGGTNERDRLREALEKFKMP